MIAIRLILLVTVLSVVSCQAEIPTHQLPISIDGSQVVDMGKEYKSSRCQGMMYTSFDKSCVDTIVTTYEGNEVTSIVIAYLDSEKRLLRVETQYVISIAALNLFVNRYRSELERFGWKLGSIANTDILSTKEDILLATDSTMSIWMAKPTINKDHADFWVSCFIRGR